MTVVQAIPPRRAAHCSGDPLVTRPARAPPGSARSPPKPALATVAVVGDGAVGLLAVLATNQLGAERVIAMSRHESRQRLAREFGATEIVEERGDEGVERIKELRRPSLDGVDWSGSRPGSYPDSKLFVTTLAAAVARLWPDISGNAVDTGWVPTRMGGPAAPDNLRLGHLTQEWLATSHDPDARTSGGYWHHQRRIDPIPPSATRVSRTNCSTTSPASPPRASPEPSRSSLERRRRVHQGRTEMTDWSSSPPRG